MKKYKVYKDDLCEETFSDMKEKSVEVYKCDEADKEKEQLKSEVKGIKDFIPGVIDDCGGGNVDYWEDCIYTEIRRCNEYWRKALKEVVKNK